MGVGVGFGVTVGVGVGVGLAELLFELPPALLLLFPLEPPELPPPDDPPPELGAAEMVNVFVTLVATS